MYPSISTSAWSISSTDCPASMRTALTIDDAQRLMSATRSASMPTSAQITGIGNGSHNVATASHEPSSIAASTSRAIVARVNGRNTSTARGVNACDTSRRRR